MSKKYKHFPAMIIFITTFLMIAFLALMTLPLSAEGESEHKHGESAKVEDDNHHEGHDDLDSKEESPAEHEGHSEGETKEEHEAHGAGESEDEHAGHDEHEENRLVALTESEIEEFSIETAVAGPGTLRNEIIVPGEVDVNAENLAHIVPRFPGIVIDVRKKIGDKVRRGDVLAIVESNEGLAAYEVTSLIDGIVIDKHITIGEVNNGEVPAFTVANLDTVWVNFSIYQMHLPMVEIGQTVILSLGAGSPDIKGTISYLSPIIDKHTRTSVARAIMDNKNGRLRPGLFVEGRILGQGEQLPILIPKTALQKLGEELTVFVVTKEGFLAQDVQIGKQNGTHVEILSGLVAGQVYVANGGFILKAEIGKGDFGQSHAH